MIKRVLILILVVGISAWHVGSVLKTHSGTLRIDKTSKLQLEGTSNVNSFSCECLSEHPPITFAISWEKDAGLLRYFDNTKFSLPIENLDCGNKMMNKDLKKALNADRHPKISINLLRTLENECTSWKMEGKWIQLKALVEIELNGCSNSYWLPVTACRQSKNEYRFISNKVFKMTDFGVEPPTAMLGVIKVKNEIKIALDLSIEVIDPS